MLKTAEDQIAYIDELIVSFRRGKNIEDDLKSLRDSIELKQTGSGWYRSEGAITMESAEGKESKSVACYRHENVIGLFINKSNGEYGSRWNITHENSGICLTGGGATLNKACKCVKDFLSGIDWGKCPEELLSKNNPDYPKIEAALKGLREAGLR